MYFFAFFPVGLDPPVRRQPALTPFLVACMGGIFLWLRYAPDTLPWSPYQLVFFPGNAAPWTVVTALFLHADWFHYLGNMAYLLALGRPLEERLGPVRFLLFFLLTGACGNLVHGFCALNGWFGAGGYGVLGASGSIAGLLALTLARCPFARVVVAYWVLAPLQGQNRAGRVRLGLPVAVASWLLLQAVHALVAVETGDGVSYAAHLGGFLLGLTIGGTAGLFRAGHLEGVLVAGRRYLERGEAHAAVGSFREYLAECAESRIGRLELARALRMAGQNAAADGEYRRVLTADTAAKRLDLAADVFDEFRRGRVRGETAPQLLAAGARLKDRQLDYAGALALYQELVEYFPEDPHRDYAVVRIAVLLRGPLGNTAAAQCWIERALDVLPPGPWRDYLVAEFGVRRVWRGGRATPPTPPRPEPAT